MEIASPIDFDFNYHYKSAPSSPNRLTELYCDFDELLIGAGAGDSVAAVPFAWEEKPGVPKTPNWAFEDDFSFDVSCDFNTNSVPAEDLFHGGVIKTVVPPPEMNVRERGRERGFSSSSRLPSRRTRSLSPIGVSNYRREIQPPVTVTKPPPTAAVSAAGGGGCSLENGSKRWSFKDLFLFRSASDGRAMDKDPFKKYTSVFRRNDHQDFRNSCEPGSMSKRRGRGSAHEAHYNLNRANSNDMKKRTYLPYKNGILGGW